MKITKTEYRKTLIISDNLKLINFMREYLIDRSLDSCVKISCSPKALPNVKSLPFIRIVNLKYDVQNIIDEYQLVVSMHCKQIFPKRLHSTIECINIHPGFNPETRGWFPQTWAIVNNLEVGVTVHRIDESLDHGEIIARLSVPTYKWDTSGSIYERVLSAEMTWISENFSDVVKGSYSYSPVEGEGNLFLKSDFDDLCMIDLNEHASFEKFYDRLRSLSFEGYKNAYFTDHETGKKVYLELRVTVQER